MMGFLLVIVQNYELSRVISNLIQNASRYGKRKLLIALIKDKEEVKLSFENDIGDSEVEQEPLLYTGSIPRSVFMHFWHENHEFYKRQNQFIDFVCINCYWNEVRVNSNQEPEKENGIYKLLSN